jgi:hypothetical protein
MAGRLASQRLVFAHLLDVADRTGVTPDLDAVDVVQGAAAERRLGHYFDSATVGAILSAGEGCDTFVLVADPAAFPEADTEHLRRLGVFRGHLVRAIPESPC